MRLKLNGFARGFGLSILASTIVAVVCFTAPMKNAHAYCESVNRGFSIFDYWGTESFRYWSTCDGDGYYAGRVRDLEQDGRYVQVRLSTRRDMSNEWIQAYTGSSSNYSIWGSWYIRICKSGTPLGVDVSDLRCAGPERHVGA